MYLTVIERKRVQYRRIVSRRGRRPSWLNQAILHKLEHYNCFITQHIDNKSQFCEKLIEI